MAMPRERPSATSTERLASLTTQPSPIPPPRAQTVTNNLSTVNAIGTTPGAGVGIGAAVKDTNIRGSMEGVETVRVTDITASSAFTKSIGSLFSTINKSVSSAFSSLMTTPQQQQPATGSDAVAVGTGGALAARAPVNAVATEATRTDQRLMPSAAGQSSGGVGGIGDAVQLSTFGVSQNAVATTATTAVLPAGIATHYSPVAQSRHQTSAPSDQIGDSAIDATDSRMRNQQQQYQPNNCHRGA